jgi:hypothetical protein
MVVLVVCLVASMGIAIVRLATTPTEILGAGYRGISTYEVKQLQRPPVVTRP